MSSRSNWNIRLLKIPLSIFCTVLLLSAILFYSLMEHGETLNTEHARMKNIVLGDQAEIALREESLRIGKTVADEFRRSYPALTFDADKLRWLEHLPRQAQALGLPSLTYNIRGGSPFESFNANNANLSGSGSGSFAVFSTPIDIDAGLVHEGQLLNYLDLLKRAGTGLFSVDACKLKLDSQTIKFLPGVKNIQAQCTLIWHQIMTPETLPASEENYQ